MIDPQSVYRSIHSEINKVIKGSDELIHLVVLAFFSGGHVLLEGAPGLGKTLLVKTLSRILSLKFNRIQFTPDLMPADIIGTTVVHQTATGERVFRFQKGPVFSNFILADEINRATAKTQAALLEAMGEGSVSIAGKSHMLEQPFFVMGTQNPLEMDGTYKLPEAQLDRFLFKIDVPFPPLKTLMEIVSSTTSNASEEIHAVIDSATSLQIRKQIRDVPVASHLVELACRLIIATQPRESEAAPAARRFVAWGVGPRGLQSLILAAKAEAWFQGRAHVSEQDLLGMVKPTFRHRILLNFEGEAEGLSADEVLMRILDSIRKG